MASTSGQLQIPHTVYYNLLVPQGPGPWPLLIVLHGFGQTSDTFVRVFQKSSREGILIAAPQAPHQFYTDRKEKSVGCSWLTIYQRDQSIRDFVEYMELFFRQITQQYEFNGEVFLLGFSQGVSMAYRAWIHSGLPVRGLIACGGDLPPDIQTRLDSQDPLPVLLIHGESDPAVPLLKAQTAHQELASRGYPVELFTFQGGHRIPSSGLAKINAMILGGADQGGSQTTAENPSPR